MLLAACGCQTAPRVEPGRGGLRVIVKAEPKIGYQPRPRETHPMDGYAPPTPESWESGESAYTAVDYSGLDDIIVWVEPMERDDRAPAPGPVVVDVGDEGHRGHHGIGAASVGATLALPNASARPEEVYFVWDSGEVTNIGRVRPGDERSVKLAQTGLMSVMREGRKQPLGQIYVAPSVWVKRAISGDPVLFTDVRPGPCRVFCWHPRLPGSDTLSLLHTGRYTDITLTVGVNGLPKVP